MIPNIYRRDDKKDLCFENLKLMYDNAARLCIIT